MCPKQYGRPHIVIIDDEPDFLTAMERSLKNLYRVTALFGSDWTFEQVGALKPDLILLDIYMPVQGGFELCRDLRADPRFVNTPILFLTASSTNADYSRFLEVGGTRFLNKTLDRRQLLAAIGEALGTAGARAI